MKNFMFYDNETGETFFVQEETLEKAKETASEYFNEPKYQNVWYDDYAAEQLGYDTY